jgi:DNA-binding MarR family transcriptional regulator
MNMANAAKIRPDLTPHNELSFAEERANYHAAIHLVERLHRQFLEAIGAELDRLKIHDINNVQSLLLFNIGREEATIGELLTRGYYLGSNVSYNVRKLVESEYLVQMRSQHDRRSSRVRLSDKGISLYEHFEKMFDRHIEAYSRFASPAELSEASDIFRKLGEFWASQAGYGPRGTF